MIKTASELPDAEQPKALLLMDPWCYSISELIMSGKIGFKCPVQMIHSEKFHGGQPLHLYDSWGCIQKTLKTGKSVSKQENVIVKGIVHEVQTDFAIAQSWEMCITLGILPKPFISEAYQLHMLLMLSYLDKLDKLSNVAKYFDSTKVREKLSRMEKEDWLLYD